MAERNKSKAAPPVLSIDDALAAKKPTIVPVPIVLDEDKNLTVTFKFASIGRIGWEKVLDDHQASAEQQAEHKQEQLDREVPILMVSTLRWDPDTFPAALLAATCVEPTMTVSQAQALWDDPAWSSSECSRLFDAARSVNDPQYDVFRASLGKGSPTTASSEPSSPPATTT